MWNINAPQGRIPCANEVDEEITEVDSIDKVKHNERSD